MRALAILMTLVALCCSLLPANAKENKPATPRSPQLVRQDLDCSGALPIMCEDFVLGSNVGEPSNVTYYSCVGWAETGGEVVYELVLPGPRDQIVFASLDSDGCDLDADRRTGGGAAHLRGAADRRAIRRRGGKRLRALAAPGSPTDRPERVVPPRVSG